jgi:hypothetical protein
VGEGGFENDSSESAGPILIERSGFQFFLGEGGMLNGHLTAQRGLSWRTKIWGWRAGRAVERRGSKDRHGR